jgi:4-diphosphocytidyl-2C-methyl-D-erythritol kinase
VASGGSSLRAMWIYPTNDQSVAFVQFDVTSDSSGALKRQLALVEMRGEKIARLLSFSPPSNALVTVTGAASPSLTRRAAARQATGSE